MRHTSPPPPVYRRDVAEALTAAGLIALAASSPSRTARAESDTIHKILEQTPPDLPSKVLTAVVVEYAPGGRSPPHHHKASIFAFVLSGGLSTPLET